MSSDRATCWSVTINFKDELHRAEHIAAADEALALARQRGWKVDGQLEKGTEGTPHYQLIVHTPQVRFSALTKAFPRAHIEQARKPSALATYVNKEKTRVGELQISQDKYPSQAKFFDLVWDIILADQTDASEYRRGSRNRFINSPQNALIKATGELIRDGYYVENIAANPMTIQSWVLWHDSFLVRKTKRQTDTASVEIPTEIISP